MRLHTKLNGIEVREALMTVKDHGLVAKSVYFEQCSGHGSRSHPHAFEIKLASWDKVPGDKRRRNNTGSHGSGDYYTATYDEWGYLIKEIFDRDPEAVFGCYKSRDDFHEQTYGSYLEVAAV
jgi:hypothetical protein